MQKSMTFNEIIGKDNSINKSFTFCEIMQMNRSDIEKYNPYHDRLGRFSSADGASSFTIGRRMLGGVVRGKTIVGNTGETHRRAEEKERLRTEGNISNDKNNKKDKKDKKDVARDENGGIIDNKQHKSIKTLFGNKISDEAKENIIKEIDEVVSYGKSNGKENLSHVSVIDGKKVTKNLYGNKSQVTFTPELMNHLRNAPERSVISIHNHPRSSSFSPADLSVACGYKSIQTLTVKGHDGTLYTVDVGSGKRPSSKEIEYVYDKYKTQIHQSIVNKLKTGEIKTENEAWKEHSHLVNEEMAKKFNWDYRRVLPND